MSALAIVALSTAYGAVWFVTARLLAGHFAWWFHENRDMYLYREKQKPTGDQWFGGGLIGLFVGLVWPLLPLLFLTRTWAVGAEQRARIRRQDDRIRELEKALEIKS
jgi:hypothetical protein